jgi:hypothetical protein
MAGALLLLGILLQPPKSNQYTLTVFEGNFVVRHGSDVVRVPIDPPVPKPHLVVLYRRDRTYAVWDDRGLTIRHGSHVQSYRLPEIAITPKLFSADEIRRTIDLIHAGKRQKDADALSGSKRIGADVYFLVRWDGADGKPWLEALVKVDLTQPAPKPVLVGKFEGLSIATKKVDEMLFLANGRLAVATRRDHDWGIASYAWPAHEFQFRSVGDGLMAAFPSGLFTEKTSYGTILGGRVDSRTFEPSRLVEDRPLTGSAIEWLDGDEPPIAMTSSPGGRALGDCETGAELPVSLGAKACRAGRFVIVWSPGPSPAHAYVYEPESWTRLASWSKPEQ